MSALGSFLREERERQKLTLKDISDKTAIRAHVLEVLEAGQFDALPSYVHAHGFLAQYVKVLGLDFQGLVKPMFDEECPKEGFGVEQSVQTEKPEAIRQSDFAPKSNNVRILIAVALVVVIGLGIYFAVSALSDDDPAPAATATATFGSGTSNVPAPAAVNTPPASVEPITTAAADLAAANPDPVATPVQPRAILRFNGECWVNYLSDDGTTAEFSAVAGTEQEITFNQYFRVHLGNASAATVEYDGNTLAGFGGNGQPIRNLYFVLGADGTMTSTRTLPAGLAN
ncbi:MAG: DUF4115 domain-containing protein [Deferribacteraceae bacterium]|jgi:cytoskeleton protein RodZ|nr:DUF4115 domain-containing protein [Deferribacteraceae bacterium]